MRRWLIPSVILACLSGLMVACYGRAIFRGEQLAYRDASQYYYPLYQRVQQEWDAGRWPLWEPEENGGMPLLGNPTAAVLYPGKLVFAVLPYPLAARLYIMGHTLLAFAAMLALARHWGTSWAGSALGALSYAFGGPVLFQHCNIIYLVGAAWLPLGFRAADRWIRLGRRSALAELAAVLVMETLGGDPQAAYLTGVCAAAYAAAIAWASGRAGRDGPGGVALRAGRARPAPVVPTVVLILVAWTVAVLAAAYWAPGFRPVAPAGQPRRPLPWTPWVGPTVAGAWVLAGWRLIARWRRPGKDRPRPVLVPMLFGLAMAAVVAAAAAAAQLLPVLEFIGQSGRAAGDGPHDIYPFSLLPTRLVEFAWPNAFGTSFRGNKRWLRALPFHGSDANPWVPTLYVGGLTLVLALGGLRPGAEGRPAPWRTWMVCVVVISLLASFGEYGSPLWFARMLPHADALIGPSSMIEAGSQGAYRSLRDGDGGPYWLLATGLPGFGRFRYPSKLLTFTVLGLTVLAARGWDSLVRGDRRVRRRTAAWSASLLALSVLALATSVALRGAFLGWLGGTALPTNFGPLDAAGALAETRAGLVQAAAVQATTLAIVLRLLDRRPVAAAVLGLAVVAADLALANARFVVTVPQSVFDSTPESLALIEQAEKDRPAPGPYRVHRAAIWAPTTWVETASAHRVRDFVAWERRTLGPKYGITSGVHYTMTLSVTELYDYSWFMGSFYFRARDRAARLLGVTPGTSLVVYPRRSFDMWNTRYFVLPYAPLWEDEYRGIASFLEHTERVYPPPDAFRGPGGKSKEEDWARDHDFQVRRNLDGFPRAWVVHDARTLPAFRGLSRAGRDGPMSEMLFSDDLSWPDPTRVVYDPRRYAWIEESDRPGLGAYLPGGYPSAGESVRVARHQPDRVELDAVLERPGIVVLADVYYPGWSLTIDGRPARLYRANRLMRGAALAPGRHTLVYTYRPMSFRVGLYLSCVGLLALCLLAFLPARRGPRSRTDHGDRG